MRTSCLILQVDSQAVDVFLLGHALAREGCAGKFINVPNVAQARKYLADPGNPCPDLCLVDGEAGTLAEIAQLFLALPGECIRVAYAVSMFGWTGQALLAAGAKEFIRKDGDWDSTKAGVRRVIEWVRRAQAAHETAGSRPG